METQIQVLKSERVTYEKNRYVFFDTVNKLKYYKTCSPKLARALTNLLYAISISPVQAIPYINDNFETVDSLNKFDFLPF